MSLTGMRSGPVRRSSWQTRWPLDHLGFVVSDSPVAPRVQKNMVPQERSNVLNEETFVPFTSSTGAQTYTPDSLLFVLMYFRDPVFLFS